MLWCTNKTIWTVRHLYSEHKLANISASLLARDVDTISAYNFNWKCIKDREENRRNRQLKVCGSERVETKNKKSLYLGEEITRRCGFLGALYCSGTSLIRLILYSPSSLLPQFLVLRFNGVDVACQSHHECAALFIYNRGSGRCRRNLTAK